jgi:Zn-dependent protease with chaperone function
MRQLSVISTGILENEFEEQKVIHNIITTFKLSAEDAKQLLKKESVIRKNVTHDFADKLVKQFSKFGLKVEIRENKTPQKKKENIILQPKLSNTPETKEEFEKLLSGEFVQEKVSTNYRYSLLLAILVSLIAPIVYLSTVFALLYLAIFYGHFLAENLGNASGIFLKILAVIVPYFIITVLILFLLRPLFSNYPKANYFEMKRTDGAALFNLIDVMCDKMSVPFPDQICLDTNVNASAGAMFGYTSLRKKKLRLTIGLPLLLGLNVREFSGILAHEFGHFAQSSAMKTYYIVNTINNWFFQRAYVPDSWDERLEEWSEKADWHIAGTLSVLGAQLSIKATRYIFVLLYKLNHRLTQYMSRAMEYDADSYESRFVGSDQFEKTSINMRKLHYAADKAEQINMASWNDDSLLANLPLATVKFAEETSEEIITRIKEDMENSKTLSMDSHPADNDRISHVSQRNDPGIFISEFPAKKLINKINQLCEAVTIDTYIRMGIHNPRKHIVANHKLIDRDDHKETLQLSYHTFFNADNNNRFLNLSPLPENKLTNHIQCMNQIRQLQPQFTIELDTFYQQLQQINYAGLAKAYLESHMYIEPSEFNIKADNIRELEYEIGTLTSEMRNQQKTLFPLDQLFYHRIMFNKALLSEEKNQQLDMLLKNLQDMYIIEPLIIALQQHIYVFHCLLNCEDEVQEQIAPTINRLADVTLTDSHKAINEAKNIKIADEKFDNLAEFIESWSGLLPTQKQTYQLDEHFDTADKICKAIHYQYYWQFAEIAELCCHAERFNKISPLSFPAQSID